MITPPVFTPHLTPRSVSPREFCFSRALTPHPPGFVHIQGTQGPLHGTRLHGHQRARGRPPCPTQRPGLDVQPRRLLPRRCVAGLHGLRGKLMRLDNTSLACGPSWAILADSGGRLNSDRAYGWPRAAVLPQGPVAGRVCAEGAAGPARALASDAHMGQSKQPWLFSGPFTRSAIWISQSIEIRSPS
jgi:hypothetical protein